MKINLSTNKIFGLLIAGYLVYIIVLSLFGISNAVWGSSEPLTMYRNAIKPIDEIVPDTVSFETYNKLKDTIAKIRDLKNTDGYQASGYVNLEPITDTWSTYYCDTCNLRSEKSFGVGHSDDPKYIVRYFLKLPGWKLNMKTESISNDTTQYTTGTDSVQFYAKNDQGYVRKLMKIGGDENSRAVNYQLTDIPVRFRYNRLAECLMIPINKSTKNVLDIVLFIFTLSKSLYILFLIIQFIKFVIDLSKGHSFTNENVNRLWLITISLLAYPVLLHVSNQLLKIIFYGYFTRDVIISNRIWDGSWKAIIAGIIFGALYKAFRQGKQLKDEQELTV